MKFQYELQRLRKQAGMSQEELGERLGVSRQTISKWENGTSYPDMLNLMTISGFFPFRSTAWLRMHPHRRSRRMRRRFKKRAGDGPLSL